MKKLLFLIPIFLYANIWLIPFSASKHFSNEKKCVSKNGYRECTIPKNENHKPLGIIYDINNTYSIAATQYTNTYNRQSKSFLISKNYHINKYFAFSLNGGIVDGYLGENIYQPIIFPSMTLKYKIFAIDIAGTHEVIFASARLKVW